MATVTQLVDMICEETGLDPATGVSGERDVALRALNQAYEQIASDTELNIDESSVALTDGTTKYHIVDDLAITDFYAFNTLWLNDSSATNEPLTRIKVDKMRNLLAGTLTNGTPQWYAVRGYMLWVSPPPSGATLGYEYVKTINELVEANASTGEETTPSLFPAEFHRSALGRMAVGIVLEGFEGREEVGGLHIARAMDRVADLRVWSARSGGISGPRDTGRNLGYRRQNDVY